MDIQPDLSICLVTRNRARALWSALEALYRTADPLSLEVIVVDNGSTDQTAKVLSRAFPQVICYENRPAESLTRAMNRALRLGRGRYLGLLADSVVVQPRALLQLLLFLDNFPEAGMAAPRLLVPPASILPSAGFFPSSVSMLSTILAWPASGLPLPRLKKPGKPPSSEAAREVEWLAGTGQILRREMVEEIGYLPESASFWFAGLEYCRLARRAGWHLHLVDGAVFQVEETDGALSALAGEEELSRSRLLLDWSRDCCRRRRRPQP